jgi:hypothetical protein
VPESEKHSRLVHSLIEWTSDTYFAGDIGDILVHSHAGTYKSVPPSIGGHIPDICAKIPSSNTTLIGEAKTQNDIDNDHTRSQFIAYLNHCRQLESGLIVIAVPWQYVNFTRRIVALLQNRLSTNVECVFLDKLP